MPRTVLLLGLIFLASCTPEIPHSEKMKTGGPSYTPAQWIEFCKREPEQCR